MVQQGLVPVGEYPAILGHEGAGIIRRLGASLSDQSLKIGDQVLLSFNSCMKCVQCTQGRKGFCASMNSLNFIGTRSLDGSSPARLPSGTSVRSNFFGQSSFSKLAVVSERSIVKCELSSKEFSVMAPMGCGYITGAGTVMNVLKPDERSSLAIIGMGAVGLSALMAAKAMGVQRLIAIDILDAKLKLATSLGATDTINSGKISSLQMALEDLVNDGIDQIIDTTGLSFLVEEGFRSLAHGGILAIVGAARPDNNITINPLDVLRGCKRLIGIVEGAADPVEVSSNPDHANES